MLPDDHPWPELGSVSRGATRGNQGSKGTLSPPGPDGRCILQLRVQPGVLAVTLTRQASEHYRILDDAVTSALKLTKGFWRKARRRQDYDAQADQDHIELNEWLQVRNRSIPFKTRFRPPDIPCPSLPSSFALYLTRPRPVTPATQRQGHGSFGNAHRKGGDSGPPVCHVR